MARGPNWWWLSFVLLVLAGSLTMAIIGGIRFDDELKLTYATTGLSRTGAISKLSDSFDGTCDDAWACTGQFEVTFVYLATAENRTQTQIVPNDPYWLGKEVNDTITLKAASANDFETGRISAFPLRTVKSQTKGLLGSGVVFGFLSLVALAATIWGIVSG